MKDHEIALLVNDLRDIAINYHDTQQLRDRIANRLLPVLNKLRGLNDENISYNWQTNPDRKGQ